MNMAKQGQQPPKSNQDDLTVNNDPARSEKKKPSVTPVSAKVYDPYQTPPDIDMAINHGVNY